MVPLIRKPRSQQEGQANLGNKIKQPYVNGVAERFFK